MKLKFIASILAVIYIEFGLWKGYMKGVHVKEEGAVAVSEIAASKSSMDSWNKASNKRVANPLRLIKVQQPSAHQNCLEQTRHEQLGQLLDFGGVL